MRQQKPIISTDELFLIWEFLPTDQQLKLLLLNKGHYQLIDSWLNHAIPSEVQQDFFTEQLRKAMLFNNEFNKFFGASIPEKIHHAFDMNAYIPFLTQGEPPKKLMERLMQTSASESYGISVMDQVDQPYHLAIRFDGHRAKINAGEITQPQQLIAGSSWFNNYRRYYQNTTEGKKIYDHLAGFATTRQGLIQFISAFQRQMKNSSEPALLLSIKQVGCLLEGLNQFNYITRFTFDGMEVSCSPHRSIIVASAIFLYWCLSQPIVVQNHSQLLMDLVHRICGYSDQAYELINDGGDFKVSFTRMELLNLLVQARAMAGDREIITTFYQATERYQHSEETIATENALAKKLKSEQYQFNPSRNYPLCQLVGKFSDNPLIANRDGERSLNHAVTVYAQQSFNFWSEARNVHYRAEQTATAKQQIKGERGENTVVAKIGQDIVTAYVGLRCHRP